MHRFEWNSCLESGDPVIDGQHRRLMGLVSEFHDEIKAGHDSMSALKMLELLASYAISHFDYEIDFYRKHGFDGLDRHIHLHDELKQKLAHRILAVKQGQRPLKSDMAVFAHDWIVHHIMEEDLEAISSCRDSSKKDADF